jgi:hypothetical protein
MCRPKKYRGARQQLLGCAIALAYGALPAQDQVADWSEGEEFSITAKGFIGLDSRAEQFFVLDLKFYLMDFEFLEKPLRVLILGVVFTLAAKSVFGKSANFCGIRAIICAPVHPSNLDVNQSQALVSGRQCRYSDAEALISMLDCEAPAFYEGTLPRLNA